MCARSFLGSLESVVALSNGHSPILRTKKGASAPFPNLACPSKKTFSGLRQTEELWGTWGPETASYAWNSNQYIDIRSFVARLWFSNALSFEMVTSSILVVIVALFAFLVMSIIGIVLGRHLKSRRQMGRSGTSED